MLKSISRAALALMLILICSGLRADCLLKPGDRMVFFGDSITEQRMYTRFVMDYFALRYPGVNIQFRNAGWVSDTAVGGLKRLQRDVLDLKPTVVSICYGMNDAGVTAYDQKIYDRYITAMKELVDTLRKNKIRVVLLTPGSVDESKASRLAGYNATLGQFASQLVEFAAKESIPIFNIQKAMTDLQTQAKAADPTFYMTNDGVHPNPVGHVVMAYGLLKALGCIEKASSLTIDATTDKATCDLCKVTDLKATDNSITFTRTDESLPMSFDETIWSAMKYFPSINEFDNYSLKITGLKPGKWNLNVQGSDAGTYSSEDLANGVNLASAPGPWKQLSDDIDKLSKQQESIYYNRWRQISLSDVPSAASAEKDALLKKMDAITTSTESERISKAALLHTWQWTLKLAE